jgi:hypothetical protein
MEHIGTIDHVMVMIYHAGQQVILRLTSGNDEARLTPVQTADLMGLLTEAMRRLAVP